MAMSDPICGALPPNVSNPVACELPPDHAGEHFSTTGCPGSDIRWAVAPDDAAVAEAAFWREREAGVTKSDRGGYYASGFKDGYARALADQREQED